MKVKIIIIILILFSASLEVKAQLIKGRVLDYETNSGVPGANIYFNNSINGTTSDVDGLFELDISRNSGQEIIISCVGYSTETMLNYSDGKFYVIYLNPGPVQLDEIVVEAKENSRKKKLKVFLREFLGETSTARKCKILNPDDLRLVFHESSNTLEAFADQPLIIQNSALGYNITYFLEEFRHDGKNTYFEGYHIFQEDTSLFEKEKVKVDKKRKKVYNGSRMHFLRILWNNQLEGSGFTIKKLHSGKSITYEELVKYENDDKKYLSSACSLAIHYFNQNSYIKFKEKDKVLFTESGYFDPRGLTWEGHMALQRMADALPFEYQPILENTKLK